MRGRPRKFRLVLGKDGSRAIGEREGDIIGEGQV